MHRGQSDDGVQCVQPFDHINDSILALLASNRALTGWCCFRAGRLRTGACEASIIILIIIVIILVVVIIVIIVVKTSPREVVVVIVVFFLFFLAFFLRRVLR